ncbi:uncharacterized protein LOC111086769 [Limulus polyphemus]|uniref:Uncharacterized protein LOC111086769 n=1 Tax=Limulus polyphemus TaxID=6850 RepID=A0ABM1SSR9_LIMPO|nr:uncharacterized protein LOC111086769 [Limulus polyphemus]
MCHIWESRQSEVIPKETNVEILKKKLHGASTCTVKQLFKTENKAGPEKPEPKPIGIVEDETGKTSTAIRRTSVFSYVGGNVVLKAEILWTLKTVASNYYNSCSGLTNLFKSMFPNSTTAQTFALSERKCSYMTVWIDSLFQKFINRANVNKEK